MRRLYGHAVKKCADLYITAYYFTHSQTHQHHHGIMNVVIIVIITIIVIIIIANLTT